MEGTEGKILRSLGFLWNSNTRKAKTDIGLPLVTQGDRQGSNMADSEKPKGPRPRQSTTAFRLINPELFIKPVRIIL